MTARAPQAAAGRSNRFFLCFHLNNPLRMGTHLLEHPGFQGRPKIPLPEPECPCAALVSSYDKASASEPQRRPSRPECKHHRKSGRANRLTRTGSRVRVCAARATLGSALGSVELQSPCSFATSGGRGADPAT